MTKKQIIDNLYTEDYMMAAVNLEYQDETIIRKTVQGKRNTVVQKGKMMPTPNGVKIWAELERLAQINIKAKAKKQISSPKMQAA